MRRRTRTDSSEQPVPSSKGTTFANVLRIFAAILFAVSALADDGLIARWSFDEGQGTNVVDSSGNGCNGVLEGMPLPVWTNGVAGFGLSFDGIQNGLTIGSSQYQVASSQGTTVSNGISAFQDFSVSAFSGFTVSAWVKAAPGVTGETVAKWSTNGLAQGSFMLSLTNGVPRFELRMNGGDSPQRRGERGEAGTYHSVLGASGRTDGQWHFVAGTYDGKQMSVWWDGRLDGACSVTGGIEQVDAPLQIGLLNAVVDEVSIWNRALEAGEVEGMYQRAKAASSQQIVASGHQKVASSQQPVVREENGDRNAGGTTDTTTATGGMLMARGDGSHVWYVNNRTGHNGNHGRDASNPKKEIAAAMSLAGNGDVIEVAAGEYRGQFAGHGHKTITLRPKGTVVLR